MESATQVWSPFCCRDILRVESVQRKFTRLILPFSGLSYPERLLKLDLVSISLEERRLRMDLTCAFKISRNLLDITNLSTGKAYKLESGTFFSNVKTRNQTREQLHHPFMLTKVREGAFFVRIIKLWNFLPLELRLCDNLNIFRRRLLDVKLIQLCKCAVPKSLK